MLVLLVMLIITIPIHALGQPQHADRHTAAAARGAGGDHGRCRLRRHHLLEREILPTKAALELMAAAAVPVQPEVHLRPNKLAEYKDVAMVMAAAQRLGVTKLGLVGNEQFVR